MDTRKTKNYQVKTVQGRYTKEDLKKTGLKQHVVQGMQDMLDLNKIIPRATPQLYKELKDKMMNGNYGTQNNATLRDVMLQSNSMTKQFMQLPAWLREHFKNDQFLYHDFLNKNKNNQYALAELAGEISGSEKYKSHIEQLKKRDEKEKNKIQEKNTSLATEIAKALKNDDDKTTTNQSAKK